MTPSYNLAVRVRHMLEIEQVQHLLRGHIYSEQHIQHCVCARDH